eukprot:CFRG7866T1
MTDTVESAAAVKIPFHKWFFLKSGVKVFRCKLEPADDAYDVDRHSLLLRDELWKGLAALCNSDFYYPLVHTNNLEVRVISRIPCPNAAKKAKRCKNRETEALVPVQYVMTVAFDPVVQRDSVDLRNPQPEISSKRRRASRSPSLSDSSGIESPPLSVPTRNKNVGKDGKSIQQTKFNTEIKHHYEDKPHKRSKDIAETPLAANKKKRARSEEPIVVQSESSPPSKDDAPATTAIQSLLNFFR